MLFPFALRVAAAVLLTLVGLGSAGRAHAESVTIDWVTVGDPGNTTDTTGYGAVADSFRIMKFEFTNSQYVSFLNVIDSEGVNPYSVYNTLMASDARGGIFFTSGATSGFKYAAKANMGDKPVNFVSWFDAARVANWLQNGQGSGSTETGAYTLGGATSGTAPAKNPGAQFYIPTENEWYKAAYYKGGSANAGYWTYATQSDMAPTTVTAGTTGIGSAGNTGNRANYRSDADWNLMNGNVTTVGTNGGPSAYGAFDMNGNVFEWHDQDGNPSSTRSQRGGAYATFSTTSLARTSSPLAAGVDTEASNAGFRLAAPVPEPSTYAMALAGIACGGFSMWLRRKRA